MKKAEKGGVEMRKIKVLVVEDSAVFREMLVKGLQEDPGVEVVAEAENAFEARDAIEKHQPDVMTLDIEMPKMSGIDFLKRLMPQYPMPVIMLSGLNGKVFEAMAAGAVDFVHKPMNLSPVNVKEFIRQELITKVKVAASVDVGKLMRRERVHPVREVRLTSHNCVVAIGASTGGPEAIKEVLGGFGTDIPGVVIVQHMPPGFTNSYAERLNRLCAIEVKEAEDGDEVKQGRALLAPGAKQMRLVKKDLRYFVSVKEEPKVSGHCPSVDVLFDSVAKEAGAGAIGVILTGMGGDGSKGMKEMRNCGAVTIGQDEETCVVYGMPKVAYDIGAVTHQLPLENIADKVYDILSRA